MFLFRLYFSKAKIAPVDLILTKKSPSHNMNDICGVDKNG